MFQTGPTVIPGADNQTSFNSGPYSPASFAANAVLLGNSTGAIQTGVQGFMALTNTASTASANNYGFAVTATINQTSVANFTDFLINRTQTAAGSGAQRAIDIQVGSSRVASIYSSGIFAPTDGSNSAPGYGFFSTIDGSQGGLGMYKKNTNQLGFSTSGILALYLDGSQNGFLTGTFQAGGYASSDGTAGLTQASTSTTGKSITVKNGLIVAFA